MKLQPARLGKVLLDAVSLEIWRRPWPRHMSCRRQLWFLFGVALISWFLFVARSSEEELHWLAHGWTAGL